MSDFSKYTADIPAAIEAGQQIAAAAQQPIVLGEGGIPFVIGGSGQPVSLEAFMLRPLRHKANPTFGDVQSFIAYVNRFKESGTMIFSQITTSGGSFVAHLDAAEPGQTVHKSHTAYFELETTPDWDAWTAINKEWKSQDDFVAFVERQRHVFSDPDSATMLEIAGNIEAKRGGNFKSGLRLKDGSRILLAESTVEATAGTAKIPIPEKVTIIIVPFEGGSATQVSAWLRFRITDSNRLVFQVEMQRPEDVVREAASEARSRIEEQTTLSVYNGLLK